MQINFENTDQSFGQFWVGRLGFVYEIEGYSFESQCIRAVVSSGF